MADTVTYPLGSLVKVRGREWVVEPCDLKDCIKLRPLGGTDDETQVIMPSIEDTKLESAVFPAPNTTDIGRFESAKLLRDALKLKLTNAAGPFRSFGYLAFEPRSYQLVPLLMALKMPVVRLLIADDVGIGKTIEAGLIVKELYERGEISKFVVLCPPHLVTQWVTELKEHFNIDAVGITARSIANLEKEVSKTEQFFEHYPAAVISLDYIKSDTHRDWFKTHIDDAMLVVDEAHTCCVGGGRQLRFSLLQDLAANEERHIILLTATPHSGDEHAFNNLLSLLKKDYAGLDDLSVDHSSSEKMKLREDLGRHLVQRRRIDVMNYPGKAAFPDRKTKEITYKLTGEWGDFFNEVREYCVDIANRAEITDGFKGRMMWYATLALLRCISSSPLAAKSALTTRLNRIEENAKLAEETAENAALLEGYITETYDGEDDTEANDQFVSPVLEDSEAVKRLIAKAESLRGKIEDPKFKCLAKHLDDMLKMLKKSGDSYRPVIFCKYIATAHYVADQLKAEFPKCSVACVTGELTNEEREEQVLELSESDSPILVATDCLSEGINLQDYFNAVVHYDLAWNPTRHEQREGRVDRFGQQCKDVWCTMLYGADNPVDGLIFNVILRKAEKIKEDLGISVPVPEDNGNIRVALVKAALLKKYVATDKNGQLELDFSEELAIDVNRVERNWQRAIDKERRNRTIFSQQSLKPEEIMPEWNKTKDALGDSEDVQKFFEVATTRLNAAKERASEHAFTLDVKTLPLEIRSQLSASFPKKDLKKPLKISFAYPPPQGYAFIHRTNPIVESLSNYLLEGALSGKNDIAARSGAYESDAVSELTAIYLLRVRYQLRNTGKNTPKLMMAEEAVAVAVNLVGEPRILENGDVNALLEESPTGNLDESVIRDNVARALDFYRGNFQLFANLAQKRGAVLSEDHSRVRSASAQRYGSVTVEPCLPVDLIGCYVLVPGDDL